MASHKAAVHDVFSPSGFKPSGNKIPAVPCVTVRVDDLTVATGHGPQRESGRDGSMVAANRGC